MQKEGVESKDRIVHDLSIADSTLRTEIARHVKLQYFGSWQIRATTDV